MNPRFESDQFKHEYIHRVRSHECDRQLVVHNARYLEMLEVARVEYTRDVLDIPMDAGTFARHTKFFFVKNYLDYFAPANFDDSLNILTRISRIGDSSIEMQQCIDRGGQRLVECVSVLVFVSEVNNVPQTVPQAYRERVRAYEPKSVEIA